MKLFSLIILFFALLSSVESQKGRARRKAATRKSSSAGDGFNMPRDKTRERKKYGTINVNMGKGKSNQNSAVGTGFVAESSFMQGNWKYLILVAGIVFVIDLIRTKNRMGLIEKQQRQVIEAKLQEEQKIKIMQGCPLAKQQKQKLRQWFFSKKWLIIFSASISGSQVYRTSVKFKNISQRGQLSFSLSIDGQDKLGYSELSGIMVHKDKTLHFYLFKFYEDRQKVDQIGDFKWLIFSGALFGNTVKGDWYFQNFRHVSKYSGNWEMRHY